MIYKPKEFAEKLNVSVRTLQRWDIDGTLIAHRNPKNRRYYTEEQYPKYIGQEKTDTRKNVIYARVSSVGQRDDLTNQVTFIQTYMNTKGVIVDEVVTDIGSGLNYNRKKWNKLLNEVMVSEINTIYISYKDRFIRFGYDWFEAMCCKFGTGIVVLNNQQQSLEQELVEDLISIIHVFSCRIYGLRKYKKKIEEDTDVNSI